MEAVPTFTKCEEKLYIHESEISTENALPSSR
jgi:hypothetical protein